MPKDRSPRTTTPENRPAARTRGNSHAPHPTPEKAPPPVTLSHEELAARAYTLFLARGGRHGDEWRDWFQAEAELRRERETGSTPLPRSESPLAPGAPRRGSRGRRGPGERDA
jgi:hypothetical protein